MHNSEISHWPRATCHFGERQVKAISVWIVVVNINNVNKRSHKCFPNVNLHNRMCKHWAETTTFINKLFIALKTWVMICESIYPHLEKNFKIYSAIPWNFCHPHSFWNFYERKKNLGTVNIGNNGYGSILHKRPNHSKKRPQRFWTKNIRLERKKTHIIYWQLKNLIEGNWTLNIFDIRVLFVFPILNTANYEMSFFNFYQKD